MRVTKLNRTEEAYLERQVCEILNKDYVIIGVLDIEEGSQLVAHPIHG